jgi:hypothetical protein
MIAEMSFPLESLFAVLLALMWGFVLQPAVLNRCHLTTWLLIFGAFRNLFAMESHATVAWGFATAREAMHVFI